MTRTPDQILLTTGELMRFFRVSRGTVRYWIKRGHLEPVMTDFEGRRRYRLSEICAMERQMRHVPNGRPRSASKN